MEEKNEAQRLAEMLDKLCQSGSGHINVTRSEVSGDDDIDITETTQVSSDCCTGNMACRIPTLHKGIDDEEETNHG